MNRSIYKLFVVGSLFAILSLQSCGSSTRANSDKNYSLDQIEPNKTSNIEGFWILKSLNNQASKDIFQEEIPTMKIDLEDKTVAGYAGCNRYNGSFSFSEGIFSAPNLASTRMMCASDNQENQFLAMLTKSNEVSINDGDLTFTNEGRIVAQFTRGIDKDLLTGKWVLESMANQDLDILFLTTEQVPTIEFNLEEGRIGGNAGCNKYGASFTVNDQYITINQILATRMACPNLQGENLFIGALTGISKIEMSVDLITFYKEDTVTLRFKKVN